MLRRKQGAKGGAGAGAGAQEGRKESAQGDFLSLLGRLKEVGTRESRWRLHLSMSFRIWMYFREF